MDMMDLGLREWFIIGGVALILIVLIDGVRRMRLAKRRATELQFGLEEIKGNESLDSSVFPTGGARKVLIDDEGIGGLMQPSNFREKQYTDEQSQSARAKDNYHLDDHIDSSLMKSRTQKNSHGEIEGGDRYTKKMFESDTDANSPQTVSQGQGVLNLEIDAEKIKPTSDPQNKKIEGSIHLNNNQQQKVVSEEKRQVTASLSGESVLADESLAGKLSNRKTVDELVVVNVFLREGLHFAGEKLLSALLVEGMRFGDMSIFHRYANANGTGEILFSMANGVKPGVFDIKNMAQLKTHVICFFMSLPGPKEPMMAFTLMVETARKIALDFGGELKDEQQSVMIAQTIEHYRQKIQDFERRHFARVSN